MRNKIINNSEPGNEHFIKVKLNVTIRRSKRIETSTCIIINKNNEQIAPRRSSSFIIHTTISYIILAYHSCIRIISALNRFTIQPRAMPLGVIILF